jgi:hypothetical protein
MFRPSLRPAAAALLLALVGTAAPSPGEAQAHYGQVVYHERIMIRVSEGMRGDSAAAQSQLPRWKEKKGPKCVAMRTIAGAALIGQNSVDLILRDRSRVRAKLESSCPALDYYHGFYVTPTSDGQICADRDPIRSRMGGECGIDKFKTLELVRDD